MNSDLVKHVDSVIRGLSGNLSPSDISNNLSDIITSSKGSNRLKAIFQKVLNTYKIKKNYGHLAAGIITALIVEGPSFIYKLEPSRLLLCGEPVEQKFYEMLKRLKDCSKEFHSDGELLSIRIQTYMNYYELIQVSGKRLFYLNTLLRNRSQSLVKALLGLAELAFLQKCLSCESLANEPVVDNMLRLFRSPEELASLISLLVWKANDNKPLEVEEFQGRIDNEVISSELMETIENGILLHEINEIAKAISCFGYQLKREKKRKSDVFLLLPPNSDFECFMRLGFIRDEIMRPVRKIRVIDAIKKPLLSMITATEYLLEKYESTLSEWAEKPYPRLRMLIPVSLPFNSLLENNMYYEDVQYAELMKDEYLLMESTENVMMVEGLDLKTFMKVWRSLYFFSTLNANAIKLYRTKYNKMSFNSLVRVAVEEKYLSNMSQAFRLDETELRKYLHLISWNAEKKGYLDLQYQPYLKVKGLIVFLPAISMISNIFRNTQVANKIRIRDRGRKFVEICKDILKKQFSRVVSEKRLKSKTMGQFTEIDIVAWHDDTIYLFECKYSLPPCNHQEMRDIWDEIQKGVEQVKVAELILRDPSCRKSYLTGWFPGTSADKTKDLKIKSCIVLSHRLFSGMELNGVPIRDFYSFHALLTEGIMSYGVVTPDEESTIVQYSAVSINGFVKADLDEYLGGEPRLYKMFRHNMYRVTHLDYVDYGGNLILARDTYLYSESLNDSYDDHIRLMDTLGFYRLPDKKMITNPLMDLGAFEDLLKSGKSGDTTQVYD